jgi:hypothetical protein
MCFRVVRPLGNAAKFMDTIRATVAEVDGKHFITIELNEPLKIPISEDKPNEVKNAFNTLIARIKIGQFQIQLDGVGEDLFSQVADEYVTQLNREIQEVYGEMDRYGLIAGPKMRATPVDVPRV